MIDANNRFITSLEAACERAIQNNIIQNRCGQPESLMETYLQTKEINKDYVSTLLQEFDKIPQNITAYHEYLIAAESNQTIADGDKVWYLKDLHSFLANPIILRCLTKLTYSLSQNLQFAQTLAPHNEKTNLITEDNRIMTRGFQFPFIQYLGLFVGGAPMAAGAPNAMIYGGDNGTMITRNTIPETSSSIRFEEFDSRLRPCIAQMPDRMKQNIITEQYAKIEDIALFILSAAKEMIKNVDIHILDEMLDTTSKYMATPLKSTKNLQNKIIFSTKRNWIDNIPATNTNQIVGQKMLDTSDLMVVNNAAAFDIRCPKTLLEEDHADNFLNFVMKEWGKADNAPRFVRFGLLIVSPKVADKVIGISRLFHLEKIKKTKGAQMVGYMGTFRKIDIIKNNFMPDNLCLLTENNLAGYGLAELPSFKMHGGTDQTVAGISLVAKNEHGMTIPATITCQIRDAVGVPTAKNQDYEITAVGSMLINLVDQINW